MVLTLRSRSEIYAADLYESAFAKDPLNPKTGRKWRDEVLQSGSSQPEMAVMERFLGRPLRVDAVFEQMSKWNAEAYA